jgi:hypothetical protein
MLAHAVRPRPARRRRPCLLESNDPITSDQAYDVRELASHKVFSSTPTTCQAALGLDRLSYGMELATDALVKEGMAVSIIRAQSAGALSTELTMLTSYIGVVAEADIDVHTHRGALRSPGRELRARGGRPARGAAPGEQRVAGFARREAVHRRHGEKRPSRFLLGRLPRLLFPCNSSARTGPGVTSRRPGTPSGRPPARR